MVLWLAPFLKEWEIQIRKFFLNCDYPKISPRTGLTTSLELLSFIGTIFVPTEQKRCKRLAKLILQTKFSARTGFMRGTFAASLVEADA